MHIGIPYDVHIQRRRILEQSGGVGGSRGADAGVIEFPPLLRRQGRQLGKRRARSGVQSAAQIQMRIKIDDGDVAAGMGVEQAFAVSKRRFVAAAQHQRARTGLL